MNKRKVIIITILSPIVIIVSLFLILNSYISVDLKELNGKGELEESFISPNGQYQANSYIINEGGATVAFQNRVSVTSITDENKEFDDETIYWLYRAEDLIIEWQDNNTIVISNETNGDKIIDINDPTTYFNYKDDL
ncbi:DUF5412 family protein [Ureibacillus composti]|uniref:DUF5412 domain-containing protein n=1 Tax=Lysinibacillus composti TaxID=720633 RepID=A0A3N9UER5_9BACI|nr:DUF5412 family protein [Lysinibacillus composti]MBM7608766.1 hypothetical protein [Lysinibacillus composti]MDM5334471.1 DUF5412 family protein [Ureibacillus composti]RQW74671.1 hypothetical protein EBB45_10605 [Lysinibacillus composti]